MSTEELVDIIDTHLQEANKNVSERLKRMSSLMDYLNYCQRLTLLSEDEKVDFIGSMEGYPVTENMRKTLNECKTEADKDYYLTAWARGTYFKRCAWLQYLHGETTEKPYHPF